MRSPIARGAFGAALVVVAAAPGADRAAAQPSPVIRISTPVAGKPVTAHPVLFRGTIQPGDPDLRLTVNGQAAFLIQGGEWATLVDLTVGTKVVSVDARRQGRLVSRAEVRVTVTGPVSETRALFSIVGVSTPTRTQPRTPYETPPYSHLFRLDPNGEVQQGQLDLDGTGRTTRPLVRGEPYDHVYAAPGVYAPVLRFTDPRGQAVVQQALVLIVDPAWVEPILQRLWARLLAAARRNDMQEVLSLTYYLKRDELRLGLEALGSGALAQWAAMMGEGGSLTLKKVADGIAVCDWRVAGRRDSPVEFILDPSGLYWQWRMR
jgi:hypothetical protein